MTTPYPPTPAQPTPAYPGKPTSAGRLTIALAVVGLIAVAALIVGIVALTKSPSATGASGFPTTEATFTDEEIASAKENLCAVYQVAARAVKEDTNGGDAALARISLTNGAGMLEGVADNHALGDNERDAALTLASAYRTGVAVSSVFSKASSVFQTSVADINDADAPMASMCP